MHVWLVVRHLGAAARVLIGHVIAAILAIGVVFMEWGWRPLAALLGRLAYFKPIAALETWIRSLPPYGALVLFGLPSVLILPLKLFALYLITHGFKFAAAGLFVGAKVVGTALVARIYQLTETALMRIIWFKRAHDVIMPYKAALVDWVRESAVWRTGRVVKARVKRALRPYVLAAKAMLALWRQRLLGR